ncbi:MAG: tetratricopeptide repeat protein, partial [Pseudomonadota bacterium]
MKHRLQSLRPLLPTCFMMLAWVLAPQVEAEVARAVTELIEIEPEVAETEVGEELAAAQTLFRAQLSGGEYEAALDQAKRVVELTARIWGGESPQVAKALTNLAIAQSETADFVAAQQNFVAAIQVQEAAGTDIVGKELINPLNGLANASIALNDLEAAVPLFERSVHISHVTAGPNNLEQLDTLD